MSTRRRIGISLATTEAARRALMQPVPCWEKQWAKIESAPNGTTLKVKQWVKTSKVQQFSDDEGEVDEPLAPLPDEPEAVDGDDEDQDEQPAADAENADAEASEKPRPAENAEPAPDAPEDTEQTDDPSKPPSPKAPALTLEPSASGMQDEPADGDALDEALNPLQGDLSGGDDTVSADISGSGEMPVNIEEGEVPQIDMSALGPDGEPFEGAQDLSQFEGQEDVLMGGSIMDESEDPFAGVDLPPPPTGPEQAE